MKKILVMIMIMFALALSSKADVVNITADANYRTTFVEKGNLAFEHVVVAGAAADVYGFLVGVNTFSVTKAKSNVVVLGKTLVTRTLSSGALKRVDTTLGYKLHSNVADFAVGAVYESYSKTAQLNGNASNTEVFAKVDGTIYKTLFTWDATGRYDVKNHTNNLEANVKLPFGLKHLKIAPSIGYGFNDPGAVTIAAFKNAKRYCLAGVSAGYFTKYGTLEAGVYQRRDSLVTAGNTINGVSVGANVKL